MRTPVRGHDNPAAYPNRVHVLELLSQGRGQNEASLFKIDHNLRESRALLRVLKGYGSAVVITTIEQY
jgi:hypothetical protein